MPSTVWLRAKEQTRTKSWQIQRGWKKRQPGKLQGEARVWCGSQRWYRFKHRGSKTGDLLREGTVERRLELKLSLGFWAMHRALCFPMGWVGWTLDGQQMGGVNQIVVNLGWSADGSSPHSTLLPRLSTSMVSITGASQSFKLSPYPHPLSLNLIFTGPQVVKLESEKYWCKLPVIK